MGILTPFTHPTDRRWRGTHQAGPLLLPIIIFLVILILIAFVASMGVSAQLWNSYRDSNGASDIGPPNSWDTTSDAVANVFIRCWALLAEIIHLPIHTVLFLRDRLHPVTALTLSIPFFGIWFTSAYMTLVMDWFWGYPSGAYAGLTSWNIGMQWLVSVLYLLYMGFAAKAVHSWRMQRRKSVRPEEEASVGVEMPRFK